MASSKQNKQKRRSALDNKTRKKSMKPSGKAARKSNTADDKGGGRAEGRATRRILQGTYRVKERRDRGHEATRGRLR